MKEERHQAILRIVREADVSTQEQLAEELRAAGFDVTQATVSRDIRELGLVKTLARHGGYRYTVASDPAPQDAVGRIQRMFREYVTDLAFSGNLIVVKTLPGGAHVVAAALDTLGLEAIVGTVAGDDAILVVCKDERPEPTFGPAKELLGLFESWREND